MSTAKMYPECKIKRAPHVLTVDEELIKSIGKNFRTLPIYEKSLFDYNYLKYYSLPNNDFLTCRWRSYIESMGNRKFTPFVFVDIRDFHFYNSRNILIPTESIHTRTDFRHKLKVGPGVDFRGQMPIPHELLMKRGTPSTKTRHRLTRDKTMMKENIPEKDQILKKAD